MHIIDRIAKPVTQEPPAIIDSVALTWEQRQRRHQKLLTLQGHEIALALLTGTRLQAGDLLSTTEGWVEADPAPEDVMLIHPLSRQETAFVAYQIGNRHLPLEIGEQGLKTVYEPILETYLEQQGLPVERTQLPFTPVSATSRHPHT
jgi:urease accessory protein